MQHQPEVAIDADGDALADAPQFVHGAVLEVLERRVDGSKEKGAGEADTFERLPEDARF